MSGTSRLPAVIPQMLQGEPRVDRVGCKVTSAVQDSSMIDIIDIIDTEEGVMYVMEGSL